jgi:hypothetical protein
MDFLRPVKYLCWFLAAALMVASCKKEKGTRWDTELLLPIATTSLSLQNIVKDSVLTTNADQSLTLNLNSTLYSLNLADQLINIPDTSIGQKFTLDSLNLPNQLIFYRASLGTLALNMKASADPSAQFLGSFLLGQNGNTVPIPDKTEIRFLFRLSAGFHRVVSSLMLLPFSIVRCFFQD